jgi:hypothetical protein
MARRLLLRQFGSAELAPAAHNAGPTAVAAYGGAPTHSALTYVADVQSRWRALQGCR